MRYSPGDKVYWNRFPQTYEHICTIKQVVQDHRIDSKIVYSLLTCENSDSFKRFDGLWISGGALSPITPLEPFEGELSFEI